jgi:diacylglycerol O-acyltransferase
MVQKHLDRLSAVDAGFLHAEDGSDAHMHIGGLAILEGPAPSYDEFAEHNASR